MKALTPAHAALLLCLPISILIGYVCLRQAWNLNEYGISLASGKVPEWDFTNLWVPAKLAWSGQLDLLFDTTRFRAYLLTLFPHTLAESEFIYPPQTLLLAWPFTCFSLRTAYVILTVLGPLLLLLVARLNHWGTLNIVLLLLSPAMFVNQIFGQNGAICSALLLGGLYWARQRPLLCAVFFGVLTFKPFYGLLAPAYLLALRCWKTIGLTVMVVLLLILLTSLFFGWDIWQYYVQVTMPLMHEMLNQTSLSHLHNRQNVSLFLALHTAGVQDTLIQPMLAFLMVASMGWCWKQWRNPRANQDLCLAATLILTCIATPYIHKYDLVISAFACVLVAQQARSLLALLLCMLVWWLPIYSAMIDPVLRPLPLIAFFIFIHFTIAREKTFAHNTAQQIT